MTQILCKFCSGTGHTSCDPCRGTGAVGEGNKKSPCPDCQGKGKVSCRACCGAGLVDMPTIA